MDTWSIIVKKYFDSTYVLYACLFIMFVTIFAAGNQGFRDSDIIIIRKILHPEYYNGEFFNISLEKYNPHYNYHYFVAFVARKLGCMEGFLPLGKLFCILQTGLTMLVLARLCKYLFNNDQIVLVISLTIFLSLIGARLAEPLNMATPFYLSAIYYFLRERWCISAFFGALLFYLHVGMAMWWFLPSCLALAIIFLTQKRVSVKQVIGYLLVVIALSFPVIYIYFGKSVSSNVDEFAIKYYYYAAWHDTSPLLSFILRPITFMGQWLIFVAFILGINKARKTGFENRSVMPLIFGVIFLYIVQFVFADIVHSSFVITLQLKRAMNLIYILGIFFFSFLLANQLRKGNCVFFLMFLFIFFACRNGVAFVVFGLALVIYELFEGHILHFLKGMYEVLRSNTNIDHIKGVVSKGNRLLQNPLAIVSVLLIVFVVPKLLIASPIKSYIKTALHFSEDNNTNIEIAEKEAYKDIFKYINDMIMSDNTVFLFPFNKWDFPVYSHHDCFISVNTPITNLSVGRSSREVKHILENDLNYSIDRLFKDVTNNANIFDERWGEMWKNLDEGIIIHWKDKYNLTHVIREKDLPLNFPVVYQNSFYVVYEIK